MRIVPVILALLLSLPAAAAAQTDTARLDLHTGQHIWVAADDGTESAGRIAQLAAGSITIDRPAGPVTLPFSRIRRIETGDTLGNGIAIGTVVGFAALGGGAAWITNTACANEGGTCGLTTIGRLMLFGVVGAGGGAGVGALVDALHHGRRTIYERRVTISGAPIISRGVRGASVSIRW